MSAPRCEICDEPMNTLNHPPSGRQGDCAEANVEERLRNSGPQHGEIRDLLDEAASQLDQLRKEGNELRKKLIRYGNHTRQCGVPGGGEYCVCGFDDALDAARRALSEEKGD